jgi:cell division protein FtsI/penicillin-binding protein 2
VGGYSTEKYIASTVGFAPASNPQFVMLVKIDYPKTSKFGAEVAAPLFKELSEYILKYYEVPYDK